MIPLAEVRAAEALAADARWQPDGPACGRSPSARDILSRSYPNLVVAATYAQCEGVIEGGCRLSIAFIDADGRGWAGHPGLAATIEPPALSVRDWIDGVRRLEPEGRSGGYGVLGSFRERLEMYTSAYGPWRTRPRDVIDHEYDRVSSCLETAPDEIATVALHLNVAPDGSVHRESVERSPGSARLPECVRQIFSALRFPPIDESATRIAAVYAYRPLGEERQVSLRVQGEDDSRFEPFYGPRFVRAAQHCHLSANHSRAGGTAMRATIRIGQAGEPVELDGTVALAPAGSEDAFRACMMDALRLTAWPCPGDGELVTVEALLCQEPLARR